jgi:type VI secretion system secreted protein Hcp
MVVSHIGKSGGKNRMKKALLILAIVSLSALVLCSIPLIQDTTFEATAQTSTSTNSDIGIYLRLGWTGTGESTEHNHVGWIEILAYNWSETLQYGGEVSSSRPIPNDFHFAKIFDRSSTGILSWLNKGQLLPIATLEVTKPVGENQVVFIKYVFSNVLITSYQISGDIKNSGVFDEFSITFTKLKITYTIIKPDGSSGGSYYTGWDYESNQPA